MPADIELSEGTESLAGSCTISRMQPGREAGRSPETGVYRGELLEGETYWAGEWSFVPSDYTDEALAAQGEIEAAILGYETQGKTLRIRIGEARGMPRIEFEKAGRPYTPEESETLVTASSGQRFSMTGVSKITLKRGAWFTHDDTLYCYIGTADLDVTANDLENCVPTWDVDSDGDEIEFRNPYLLGRYPQTAATPLPMGGDMGGPWTIPFEEAE